MKQMYVYVMMLNGGKLNMKMNIYSNSKSANLKC